MKPQAKRRPPAFQCYASDTLADRRFLLMSAAERGLLMSMRMACWVSDEIPRDPPMLARVLGLPVDDVAANLKSVLDFFAVVPGNSGNLHDPELDGQRDRLRERRERQAEGGAKGAGVTNKNKSGKPQATESPTTEPANPTSTPTSTPPGESPGSSRLLSRAEKNRAEQSGTPSLVKGNVQDIQSQSASSDPWISEYQANENDRPSTRRTDNQKTPLDAANVSEVEF